MPRGKKYSTEEERIQAKANRNKIFRDKIKNDPDLLTKHKMYVKNWRIKKGITMSLEQRKTWKRKPVQTTSQKPSPMREQKNAQALECYYRQKSKNPTRFTDRKRFERENLSVSYLKQIIANSKNIKIRDIPSDIELLELEKISILSNRLIKQSKQNEQEKVV